MLKNEDIDTLVCLGLSTLQAKVYLALVEIGRATTKALAEKSNVARQDIYRITAELQNIGIVEKVIAVPNEYRATPIQDSVNILLDIKQRENSEAQKKAVELLERKKDKETETAQDEKSGFVLISKNQAFWSKIAKSIETTQNSIDAITSWIKFLEKIDSVNEEINRALDRGVTIRVIIEDPVEFKKMPKKANLLIKKSLFKVKTAKKIPTEILTIYDRKETLMTTSAGDMAASPALWSDNPCIVCIAQDAFEKIWQTAKIWRMPPKTEPKNWEKNNVQKNVIIALEQKQLWNNNNT